MSGSVKRINKHKFTTVAVDGSQRGRTVQHLLVDKVPVSQVAMTNVWSGEMRVGARSVREIGEVRPAAAT
jgi:hypothetical protein